MPSAAKRWAWDYAVPPWRSAPHQIAHCNLGWCIPAMSGHLLDMVLHLLATPWHLLVTSWHLPATSLYLRAIPQHLLPTPWHVLATPQHLLAIPWHRLVTLWNVLATPWHLLATSCHLLITPQHPLATSRHLLATLWHLLMATAPSPAWKLSRQSHHPWCPAGDIREVTTAGPCLSPCRWWHKDHAVLAAKANLMDFIGYRNLSGIGDSDLVPWPQKAGSSLSLPGFSRSHFKPPRAVGVGRSWDHAWDRGVMAGPAHLSSEHPPRTLPVFPPTWAENTPPRTACEESYFRDALFFFSPLQVFFIIFKIFFLNNTSPPHLGCELGASISVPNAQRLLFINASNPKVSSCAARMHPGKCHIPADAASPCEALVPPAPSSAHPKEQQEQKIPITQG